MQVYILEVLYCMIYLFFRKKNLPSNTLVVYIEQKLPIGRQLHYLNLQFHIDY